MNATPINTSFGRIKSKPTNNTNMKFKHIFFLFLFVVSCSNAFAWIGMPTPNLHVEGRNLKDAHGNIVVLHGFAQTYSPWFNEQGTKWTNYNVSGCLTYNKGLIDKILAAGWKMNFLRLHMDPYWSNTPGVSTTGENDISAFNYTRFKTYLDQVFIPMTEYAISKGLYVVMRPPGVCPEKIAVGDAYNQYLLKVWGYVSTHSKLKNNPGVMFELANEPVNILGTDGTYGSGSQGHFDNLKTYFQSVVDTIRTNGCKNILWVPGLAYQSRYSGYSINPIQGENIGYAVHIYPGWFGSGSGYDNFQKGWDEDVKPVANFAPICVTEMDWAPAKYNASWGKDSTGVAGGMGFGANFKKIADASENASWLFFTDASKLAKFTGIPPAADDTFTFLNDPQACPLPCFSWYNEYAQTHYPRPDYTFKSGSDNGNGTYTNPVIFGDFPDVDAIRVGDIYYMVSTTMSTFPGATILKSYDLVNWEYCSNPLTKIESSNCYNLDGCNVYGKGMWASSLKYNNGKFYLLFNTLDEGGYLLTATDPAGVWSIKKLNTGFYDPGMLFDTDGKVYVVYGINDLRIAQVDANFNKVKDQKVYTYTVKSGLEGSHLYKINGYYYIYSTYGGWPAYQTVMRSTSIWGPYEENPAYFNNDNIHQGSLIQTQTGEWWTMLFYDKGAYGRLPNLQPITWVNNWPIIGSNNVGVTTYKKPNVGKVYPKTYLPTNDSFRDYKLGPQWSWNHNPDNSKWSLTARPGFLRLKTVNVADSLERAKNTLTQRILGYTANNNLSYGTIKLHINEMLEGDVAGLSVFQDPYAYIGVKVINGQKKLIQLNTGVQQLGSVLTDSVVYLRSVVSYATSKATFYYSLDNETYTAFGTPLNMKFDLSVFMGNRFYLFNYATLQTGGYVDIDWFSTEQIFSESKFFDDSFTGFSESALSLEELRVDCDTVIATTGSNRSFTVTAVYLDGHTEDVTLSATYENSNPTAINILNGQIVAKQQGDAIINITYQGGKGDPKTASFVVNSTYFPFVSGVINPSIYGTGSFVESTRTLTTSLYGFGGWVYSNGIDLSAYKYLVAKLSNVNTCGASLRIFDENNYWTGCAQYDFGSSKQLVVTLANMKRFGTTTKVDPTHIYIIGIWSTGCPIKINDIYLTNNSDYSKPTAIENVIEKIDENKLVDVYTIMGIKVRSSVLQKEAIRGLPIGVYIVGNKKIAVLVKE
jgi:beta-xylosidase